MTTTTGTTPTAAPVSLVRRPVYTPIWEHLLTEWKPRLNAAHLAAVEAQAATDAAMGDWA